RKPLRSRPRKCTISSSTDIAVVTRPLRRFFRITLGRLLHAIPQPCRTPAILNSVDPALVGLFGNKIETKLFANNASKKAAHRMLLPFRGRHDCGNSCARWRTQHRKNAGVLGV